MTEISPENRMQSYLQKIAAGPKLSKDLTEEEAEDALSLILDGEVSEVRMGVFLIAARMKVETVPENIGYWRALQKKISPRKISLNNLLQIADPFDGFQRIPYFGFYAIPVLAELGLPTYGHSALPLPPKFGITFDDLLVNHYQFPKSGNGRIKKSKNSNSVISVPPTLILHWKTCDLSEQKLSNVRCWQHWKKFSCRFKLKTKTILPPLIFIAAMKCP